MVSAKSPNSNGRNFRVGQSHQGRRANRLRHCAPVNKVGIGKMRVPVKIVVDRVINPAVIFAAIAEVQRRDTQMIEKRSEVRPRSQRRNPYIRPLP